MTNKYRLLLIITSLLVVGFFLTSFVSYKIAIDASKNELKYKSLPLSSDNIFSEIQRDILKPNIVSSLMANDTFMRNWIMNGEQDLSLIQNYLATIKSKYNTSSSFLVSDKTKNYYYSKGFLKKISPTHPRDIWFYRVKNAVDEYESNIDADMAANDSLTIFINYRVYDFKNNFIGVTGVGLKTSHVSELLETYKAKYNHNIYFVNNASQIVLSAKNFRRTVPAELKNFFASAIKDYNRRDITKFEYEFEGEEYLLNVRYIDELNLYLFVDANENYFSKEIQDSLYINILIFVILIIAVIGLILFNIDYYQNRLEILAKSDKLTTLANRHAFDSIFDRTFHSLRKDDTSLSLILMDIDNFKSINDTFGHLTGDLVLKEVAAVLKSTFRQKDIIARWGGEEFIVLLPNVNHKNAFALAEKLRLAIFNDKSFNSIIQKSLTVSLGVVTKLEFESKEEFFKRVDDKLYEAKKAGKNITKGE